MQACNTRIGQKARKAKPGRRAVTLVRAALAGRRRLLGLSGTLATIAWLWMNTPPPL